MYTTAHQFSTQILKDIPKGTSPKLFPLLAVCKFQNNLYTMEEKKHLCTLPLNMYNGPVFAVNCLILFFLTIAMMISIIVWTIRLYKPGVRDDLVWRVFRQSQTTASRVEIARQEEELILWLPASMFFFMWLRWLCRNITTKHIKTNSPVIP